MAVIDSQQGHCIILTGCDASFAIDDLYQWGGANTVAWQA